MATIETYYNTVLMQEIYHNTVRLDEAYMNGVIVYKRVLELVLPQYTATFNLRTFINANNPNNIDTVEITNNFVQPSMVSGDLTGFTVTLVNSSTGEFRGTNIGSDGIVLTTPITIINNGWIRGAGGSGGKGGNGGIGSKGVDGADKTITYDTFSTIPANTYMWAGTGNLSHATHTEVPSGTYGFTVSARYTYLGNNTVKGEHSASGPCASESLTQTVAGSNQGVSHSDNLCGEFEMKFFLGLYMGIICTTSLVFDAGTVYKSGTANDIVAGGTGGNGGAGGIGCNGTGGISYNSTKGSRVTSCIGLSGSGGSYGTRNTLTDPTGKTWYGNYGTIGNAGGAGGYGGAGGNWGQNGENGGNGSRGANYGTWGTTGANGTLAGKSIRGVANLGPGSLIGNTNGSTV